MFFIGQYETYKTTDLSESDTRSKLIDNLLISVLGWEEKNITREEHNPSGYYDYKISIAGFNVIIEAKKQFNDFKLPNTNRRKVKLSTIYNENKDVIDQIRNYLSEIGCDLGIITNGRQFIIGKFINTNGVPWKDNHCIIYRDTEDIKSNFVEFWNNLSKEAIIKNGGINLLYKEQIDYTKKIISTIPTKDNEITRNDISSRISPLISKVFGEIYNNDENNNDIEFIKECFVENKDVIKHKAELNGLFSDDAPLLVEVTKAKNHNSIIGQINEKIISQPPTQKNQPPPKPIIIIGSKGAGKTTFISYLFNNCLSNDTINHYPNIYINFMKYYKGSTEINFEEIAKDAIQQFDEKYPLYEINSLKVLKRIYIKEINEKDKGVWLYIKTNNEEAYQTKLAEFLNDKTCHFQQHLEALNGYLIREIHKRAIIIFDNADQLDDIIQEKIFLYACSLNTKAQFGVFISLREGYYYKWRNSPPFNAFESSVYHISSPDYGIVLQRRINYSILCLKKENNNIIKGYNNKGAQIHLDENDIISFFEGIRGSLFGEENSPILEFIRHITFPNVREGLRLFKTFLTSGYTNVEEYVMRVNFNTNQHCITIPIHEFTKTIGLGNKLYYNHSSSDIQNIFYPCNGSDDYFIKTLILNRLDEQLQSNGTVNKYINYNLLMEEFINYGYKEYIINQELEYLLHNGFVDNDRVISDIRWDKLPNQDFSLSITSKGYYYIQEIINKFYYIELVLQDTPIYDREDFEKIRTVFPLCDSNGKRDMNYRIEVVKLFIDYLEKNEKKLIPNQLLKKYGSVIGNIRSNGLEKEIERIRKKTQNSH